MHTMLDTPSMADDPNAVPLPGIAALPPTTVRQIGSGQVLVDPSSVVKELIDNALDARAKSIFVDITANTIDSIQVKDDGHGIPAEDRALVCRRYCTSKIRDFHDLKEVGGKWLGFRGEAMSSMAEMSGTLSVSTRVEGEPVAVKLKYGRNGELISTERESHPVGTTVKVTSFFEHIPVRKQTAMRNSQKWLAKIRRMMQAYALARPAVRFRLHVLKAKNDKGDFIYAPRANANVEDAVFKVIGKDCALQCDWTALETDGFEIHAFLPKPTANGSKLAKLGAFISVDARPVCSSRGTIKQVVAAFKDRLRKSNAVLGDVKDPFFCMNIICPPDSYDPNVEPAKDDVMFENGDVVVGAAGKLLKSYYPEAIVETEDFEPPTSAQQYEMFQPKEPSSRGQTPVSICEDPLRDPVEEPLIEARREQPRWRSSMYGIDEDDLEFLQENQPPIVEEEEGLRAAAVSNLWTIARMNAVIKPKKATHNGQLLSPAKSQSEVLLEPSSPAPATIPLRPLPAEPLTPQTLSKRNASRSSLDSELERSIQHLPQPSSERHAIVDSSEQTLTQGDHEEFNTRPFKAGGSTHVTHHGFQRASPVLSDSTQYSSVSVRPPGNPNISQAVPFPAPSAPRRSQRRQPTNTYKPFAPPVQELSDTWFGQPMRGSEPSQPPHRQKRSKNQEVPLFASDVPISPRRPVLAAVDRLNENRLLSEKNTDIRDFFRGNGSQQREAFDRSTPDPSFTPINLQAQTSQLRGHPHLVAGNREGSFHSSSQRGTPFRSSSRATSAEPPPRSKHTRDQLLFHSDSETIPGPRDMAAQLQAYVEREGPPRASSVGSMTSMLFDSRPDNVRDALQIQESSSARPGSRNMICQFRAYGDSLSQVSALRSPLGGSDHPSRLPQRSNEVTTALDRYQPDKISKNAQDTQAQFSTYEERDAPLSNRSASSSRRKDPHIAPAHETTSKSRQLRRRTTDGLERTKSSKLPLERVPQGYQIQNVVQLTTTNIKSVVQSSRKLDMRHNSVEWGYLGEHSCDVFAETISERKIMNWVIKLDEILHSKYERMDGVDTRCGIHEGIQRGLDTRKEEKSVIETIENIVEDIVEVTVSVPSTDVVREVNDAGPQEVDDELPGINVQQHVGVSPEKAVDEMSDFDMSQFVDLDSDSQMTDVRKVGEEGSLEKVDEYDDDIEDEMLMGR